MRSKGGIAMGDKWCPDDCDRYIKPMSPEEFRNSYSDFKNGKVCRYFKPRPEVKP
jgi:hypothetical protein